jgi:hypothetical protein
MTPIIRCLRWLSALLAIGTGANAAVQPGENLQALLDRGDDLQLQQGAVYPINGVLKRMGRSPITQTNTSAAKTATVSLE